MVRGKSSPPQPTRVFRKTHTSRQGQNPTQVVSPTHIRTHIISPCSIHIYSSQLRERVADIYDNDNDSSPVATTTNIRTAQMLLQEAAATAAAATGDGGPRLAPISRGALLSCWTTCHTIYVYISLLPSLSLSLSFSSYVIRLLLSPPLITVLHHAHTHAQR